MLMKKIKEIFFLTLLFVILPIQIASPDEYLKIIGLKGLVQIKTSSQSSWIKASSSSKLITGDSIRTFLESSVILEYPDKSTFELGENSALQIKDISKNPKTKASNRELKLSVGTLHYKVSPMAQKASEFKIHSSTSIVGITGTEGYMKNHGDGKDTENYLEEGSTYNTDDQGNNGSSQREGKNYSNGEDGMNMYDGDEDEHAQDWMAIDGDLRGQLDDLIAKVEAKRREGFMVSAVNPLFELAFSHLEKHKYDLVRSVMQEAKQILDEAKRLQVPTELADEIKILTSQIKSKDEEGFDVSQVYALLGNIDDMLQQENFEEETVRNLIAQISQKLASLPKPQEDGHDFSAHLQEIQEKIFAKEEKGFVMDEVKVVLRQCIAFFDAGDIAGAYQLLAEARKKLNAALKELPNFVKNRVTQKELEIAQKKQEGYDTVDLEMKMAKIWTLIEDEFFVEAKSILREVYEGLKSLEKSVPAQWNVKVSAIKDQVKKQEEMGFDLSATEIYTLLQSLEKYFTESDLVNLEIVFGQLEVALKDLGLPLGFQADWDNFLIELKEKESEGLDVSQITELRAMIQSAIDSGNIKFARDLLKQAKDNLAALIDTEPPEVQVLTFEETEDQISVEGFAHDNTRVEHLLINGSDVSALLNEQGEFKYTTAPSVDLSSIIVVAEDIADNTSPPIVLELTIEAKRTDIQGEIVDARLEYSHDAVSALGMFLPGAKVIAAATEGFCDAEGHFAIGLNISEEMIATGTISIWGGNPDGSQSPEVTLDLEDKWPPSIEIEKVYFSKNMAPSLNIKPLAYTEDSAVVLGNIVVSIMANVEGNATDLGSEVILFKIGNRDVPLAEGGKFAASFSLSPSEATAKAYAQDSAGNTNEENIAFDAVFTPPTIKINGYEVLLNAEGEFSKEIFLTKESHEIIVELFDAKGNYVTSKRLTIADILPPELEILDVSYTAANVIIQGKTDPHAKILDKTKILFTEEYRAGDDGLFTIEISTPASPLTITLTSMNFEGKESQGVDLAIEPIVDEKAPKLYLSAPQFQGSNVIIEGSAEDASGIESVTMHGEALALSAEGRFSGSVEIEEGLTFFNVIAKDIFGNEISEVIAVSDSQPPEIVIDNWEIQEGRLIISGKAQDNVGVREVRINDAIIAYGEGLELAFNYEGILSENLKDVTLIAVDLFNNIGQEGPRTIEIPTDDLPPEGGDIALRYEGTTIFIEGKVHDPAGIKNIYVQGRAIEPLEDGSFSVQIHVDVAVPEITLEQPSYDNGKVVVAGKVASGGFTPAQIVVEAEDLSENRGEVYREDISLYNFEDISALINEQAVVLNENGGFSQEVGLTFGQTKIDAIATDSFGNQGMATLELEKNSPLLTLNDLEYLKEEEVVIVSGQAMDNESGLYNVLINGIVIEHDAEGSFKHNVSFSESSIGIVATDFVGNGTSQTKESNPPDIWPPVFFLNITPVPAIVGSPVSIEITSKDSRTFNPEILSGIPTVTAMIGDQPITLQAEGEGSNFIATMQTDGLNPTMVTVSVQGTDTAENISSEVEGNNVFAIVEQDSITPSFSIEVVPSPMVLGEEATIKVFASEELKTSPEISVSLPSNQTQTFVLTKTAQKEYQSIFTPSLEESIGKITLTLTGGEDNSGNVHQTTEVKVLLSAPQQATEIPLEVTFIEFTAERFTLKGSTAAEAIVHIESGEMISDIVANPEGNFTFEETISSADLKEFHQAAEKITVRVKAHNYAGFESVERVFEVDVPDIPETGGENFLITVEPSPVEQGSLVIFNVEVLGTVTEPKGILYLSDGKKIPVELNGSNTLSGQHQIPEDAVLGPAMFEVVSDVIRESVQFDIVLSSEWQQKLNKDDFFGIRVNPDPMMIGEDIEVHVNTEGDIERPPPLEILLPGGKTVSVPLSGGPRNFNGIAAIPADAVAGGAEIILNSATELEVRRPCGVEEKYAEGVFSDVFVVSNPSPLLAGSPFNVKVSFSQNIPFKPELGLKLSNGDTMDISLDEDAGSSSFQASTRLDKDAAEGLATFVIKNDNGLAIDSFPTQVVPPLGTKSGIDIFMMPDVLTPMERGTIKVTSSRDLGGDEGLKAYVSFRDGSKIIVALVGQGPEASGFFEVPQNIALGMISISVIGRDNVSLGNISAEVVQEKGTMGTGGLRISLDNPEFGPNDRVMVFVEGKSPLNFRPKAILMWDGGSLNIPLSGSVPGNRFEGGFTAPREPIDHGRIEVHDDQGYMLGEFFIESRRAEGEGDIILTPMPPMIGQPLSVEVITPEAFSFKPRARLIFAQESKDLNLYGSVPGDRFMGSIPSLENPLEAVEVLDNTGAVLVNIPVGGDARMGPMEFDVQIPPQIESGQMVPVNVNAMMPMPFVPRLSLDFSGRIIDVPLSGVPSGMTFSGSFFLPSDIMMEGGINASIFSPDGKIVWQRLLQREGRGGSPAGALMLHVMPAGEDSFDLNWDMLRGAAQVELVYSDKTGMEKKIDVTGSSYYRLSGLTPGMEYFLEVIAYNRRKMEITRSPVISAVCGKTTRELYVQDVVVGNEIHLMWDDYPGSDGYRVSWGNAPGSYSSSQEVQGTVYVLSGLVMGQGYFIKVSALQAGVSVGDSREIMLFLQDSMPQGADIWINPDPSQINQELEVTVHFFGDVSFIPKVLVRFIDGTTQSLNVSGEIRDFRGTLSGTNFTKEIDLISVEDHRGRHIAERFMGHAGLGMRAGSLHVMPMPPMVGSPVDINVEIPMIVPMSPRLRLMYADGMREEINLEGSLPGTRFSAHIDKLKNPLMSIDLLDPFGTVKDTLMIGNVGPRGHRGLRIIAMPDPPRLGEMMQVSVEFNEPVPFSPKLTMELEGGLRKEYMLPGAWKMMFDTVIPAADITASVMRISVEDDKGMFLGDIPFAMGGVMGLNVMVNPDPPALFADLNITADFGQSVPFTPQAVLYFADGSMKPYSFGARNQAVYTMTVSGDEIKQDVRRIEIQDEQGGFLSDRMFGFGGPMGGLMNTGANIIVMPDPPTINTALSIKGQFSNPIPFVPELFVEYMDGSMRSYPLVGEAGLMEYTANLPAAEIMDNVMAVEIRDPFGVILVRRDFGGHMGGPGRGGAMIDVMPDPPLAGSLLNIKARFGGPMPFIPQVMVEFLGGNRRTFTFPGTPGMSEYSVEIPEGDLVNDVMGIEIKDPFGMFLGRRDFGGSMMMGPMANVMVNPDPPTANMGFTVMANLGRSPRFTSTMIVFFESGEPKHYELQEGIATQELFVPDTDVPSSVTRIEIKNNQGIIIGEWFGSGTRGQGPMANIMVMPDPPTANVDLEVRAEFPYLMPTIPQMIMGLRNGTVKNYMFPGSPGMQEYTNLIPAVDITDAVDWIEIKDDYGMPLGRRDFAGMDGPGGTGFIMLTPSTPMRGMDLNVRIELPKEAMVTPTLYIDFEDGRRVEHTFPQGPQLKTYEIALAGDIIPENIRHMEVIGANGRMLAEWFGSGGPSGGHPGSMVTIVITPDPAIANAALDVEVSSLNPLPFVPEFEVHLINGNMKRYTFSQEPNLMSYNMTIPAADIIDAINFIEVRSDSDMIIGRRDFTGDLVGVGTGPRIEVMPDPPMLNQGFTVSVNFDAPPQYNPRLEVHFESSPMQQYPMQYGMAVQDILIPHEVVTSHPISFSVWNSVTGAKEGERFFSPGAGPAPALGTMSVTPTPPVIGSDMTVRVDFPDPSSVTPDFRVEFDDMTSLNYQFPQAPGMMVYEMTIPGGSIAKNVHYIEAIGDNGTVLAEWFGTGGPMPTGMATIDVNPDPPSPYTLLNVTINFPEVIQYTPKLEMMLEDGTNKNYYFAESFGQTFTMSIAAADITTDIQFLQVWDDMNTPAGRRDFAGGGYVPAGITPINVTPDPPMPYASVEVSVTFPDLLPFTPQLYITFNNGSPREFYFPQGPGFSTYSVSISSTEITDSIIRIECKEPGGMIIADWVGGGAYDYSGIPVNCTPADPQINTDLTCTATFTTPPTFRPKWCIEFGTGNRQCYDSPVDQGYSEYTYTFPAATITDYVHHVEIEDNVGTFLGEMMFGDAGDPTATITVSHDPPDPTEDLTVTVTFPGTPPFYPRVFMEFVNSAYSRKDYLQNEQLTSYVITIPNADILGEVLRIGVEDDGGYLINDIYFGDLGSDFVIMANPSGANQIDVGWPWLNWAPYYEIYYGNASGDYTSMIAGAYTNESPVRVSNISSYLLGNSETLEPNYTYYIQVKAYSDSGYGVLERTSPEFEVSLSSSSVEAPASFTSTSTVAGEIHVTWDQVPGVAGYKVYWGDDTNYTSHGDSPATISGFTNTNHTITGLNGGDWHYVIVESYYDNAQQSNNSDPDQLIQVSTGAGGLHHLHLTSNNSSSQVGGNPIFVTMTAHDSSHLPVISYSNASVNITVNESGGSIPDSSIISTQDRVTGAIGSVAVYNGYGSFTVDDVEAEEVSINTSNVVSDGPLSLEFTAATGTAPINKFGINGPSNGLVTAGTAQLWLAAIDANGNVITDYTGTADLAIAENVTSDTSYGLSLLHGSGTLSGDDYTFHASDSGVAILQITNSEAETLTFSEINQGLQSGNYSIIFQGAQKYMITDGNNRGTGFSTNGTSVSLSAMATLDNLDLVSNYNGTADLACVQTYQLDGTTPTGDCGSVSFSPNPVNFSSGVSSSFSVEYATPDRVVKFTLIQQGGGPPASGDIWVTYKNTGDQTPPEIVQAVAETPYLIRIYFSEDVDQTTAEIENNYNVGAGFGNNINKVCLYGDEVTLHLAAVPGSGLGGTFNLTIQNIQGTDGNVIQDVNENNIPIPAVDHQGGPLTNSDWFEIVPNNASPEPGETVRINVYHKNQCGYLKGSNAVNKTTTQGSLTVNYSGTATLTTAPSSVDISSGEVSFDITLSTGVQPGQTVIISVSGGSSVEDNGDATLNVP